MRLPFADEIREARALAEESSRAGVDVASVESALVALGVVDHQLRLRPELEVTELPADRLVEELAERWPALSDLEGTALRAGEPILLRIEVRRGQLEIARRTLRPLANEIDVRGVRLHELQHEQQHALEDPRWSELAAELMSLVAEREQVAAALRPTEHRLAMIRPLRAVIDPLSLRLAEELARRDEADPSGVLSWRAAHLARAILASLASVIVPVQIELPLPPPPPVPETPSRDPEVQAALWWDVQGVLERLGELSGGLAAQTDALLSDQSGLQGRLDELNRKIMERTG